MENILLESEATLEETRNVGSPKGFSIIFPSNAHFFFFYSHLPLDFVYKINLVYEIGLDYIYNCSKNGD